MERRKFTYRNIVHGTIVVSGDSALLWLYFPYFAATAVEAFPRLRVFAFTFKKSAFLKYAAIGLSLQTGVAFLFPTNVNPTQYPVEEMTYIIEHTTLGEHPKVMAPYGKSGYVLFRGGDALSDGRQDPFITDGSKGIYGWTAFERSMYGFSERLPAIVHSDQPDYIIAQRTQSSLLLDEWTKQFGKPVFRGRFGSVYQVLSN
ncbi:hypothetical protein ACFSR7_27120 [Cohnella sp. GCM10020058]|uniref:hypothetical protein n=1 Tax=Cohnella sp. GCM10020058 TaxID=3317330 RepID=UPI00362CAE42